MTHFKKFISWLWHFQEFELPGWAIILFTVWAVSGVLSDVGSVIGWVASL